MPPTLSDRLSHILEAIDTVQSSLKGKTRHDFERDRFLRLAVERAFEIISEASRHIPDSTKAAEGHINWTAMAALGNRLRHAYHRIDAGLLLEIAIRDLPPLKAFAKRIVREDR